MILFGEVYGSKVQNLAYGKVGAFGFVAFDARADGRYLDPQEFETLCARHDVPAAPVVYRGPYSLAAVKAVSDGPTTLGAGHIREGVVVRPERGRNDPKLGRLVLKYIGDEYLLAKGITDTDDV